MQVHSGDEQRHDSALLGGKFKLLNLLGEGAQGRVYEAVHQSGGKKVAIKLLKPELAQDAERRAHFAGGYRTLARIRHQHIVEVHEVAETQQRVPYVVMELLQGQTLAQEVEARGSLPIAEACELMRQVLAALIASHRRGLLHHHLTPEHVMMQPAGRRQVKVLGFGTADVTKPGGTMHYPCGTGDARAYTAPELQLARAADERADLYSAGAILQLLLSGEPPRLAALPGETQKRCPLLHELNPAIPVELSRLVSMAKSSQPDQRPSAAQLSHALAGLSAMHMSSPSLAPARCTPRFATLPDGPDPTSADFALASPWIPRAPTPPQIEGRRAPLTTSRTAAEEPKSARSWIGSARDAARSAAGLVMAVLALGLVFAWLSRF